MMWEFIPTRDKLELKPLDVTRTTWLEFRETFWYEPETYPEFAIKCGFNGFP